MATGRIIRNVAVNDLGHGNGAILGKEVKDLVFDACLVQRQPGVVGPGQLAIRRVGLLCLLGNGLDGRWAIDGLLGAGDVGQPRGQQLSISNRHSIFGKTLEGWTRENGGACALGARRGDSYCCFAQLNMLAGVSDGDETGG